MTIIVGVDGGNTKTVALVSTTHGNILGKGRRGCGDIYGAVSPEAALNEIQGAVDDALSESGLTRSNIEAACFSLAGADWEDDYTYLQAELEKRELARKITVYNDGIGALRAGASDGTGIIIACGTGATVAARNAEGLYWHSSFWQESLGGSALGDETLRCVVRAELGLEVATTLTERILVLFNQPTVEALLKKFYQREQAFPDRISISKIAPLVLQEADAGDSVARKIVREHGIRLGEYAIVAERKIGLNKSTFPVVLNGGIFRQPSTQLIQAISDKLVTVYPDVSPQRSHYEPVVGALFLAIESLGIRITESHLHQIKQTLPPSTFFAT